MWLQQQQHLLKLSRVHSRCADKERHNLVLYIANEGRITLMFPTTQHTSRVSVSTRSTSTPSSEHLGEPHLRTARAACAARTELGRVERRSEEPQLAPPNCAGRMGACKVVIAHTACSDTK